MESGKSGMRTAHRWMISQLLLIGVMQFHSVPSRGLSLHQALLNNLTSFCYISYWSDPHNIYDRTTPYVDFRMAFSIRTLSMLYSTGEFLSVYWNCVLISFSYHYTHTHARARTSNSPMSFHVHCFATAIRPTYIIWQQFHHNRRQSAELINKTRSAKSYKHIY